MTIQAGISLYRLGESALLPAIHDFLHVLKEQGLITQTGAMSTMVAGESATVFAGIGKAFEQVAADHRCVLMVKYSNACPPSGGEIAEED